MNIRDVIFTGKETIIEMDIYGKYDPNPSQYRFHIESSDHIKNFIDVGVGSNRGTFFCRFKKLGDGIAISQEEYEQLSQFICNYPHSLPPVAPAIKEPEPEPLPIRKVNNPVDDLEI
jgi:hypothetical protein